MAEKYSLGFDGAFLDALRSRSVLTCLISKDLKLTRAGREWKACCPFHNEQTPSFVVSDEKGFYHCFGCGAHGDAIRWMTDARGVSFKEAVTELAKGAGLNLPCVDVNTLGIIADLICGDAGPRYRKGWELTNFFASAGLTHHRFDGTTRRLWVLDALKSVTPDERRSLILHLVSPQLYEGDAAAVRQVLDRLNPLLKLEGIYIKFSRATPHLAYVEPSFDLDIPDARGPSKSSKPGAAQVFVSYAHADEQLKDKFLTHLAALKRE